MSLGEVIPASCPVCSHSVAAPFFDGGRQPLATLGWPASAEAAKAMARLAHDFVQCPSCTHVWNRSFSYDDVPYSDNPNRMFNNGLIWKDHLADSCRLLVRQMPPEPTLVEIGCGEGHFLRALAQACGGKGKVLGFDPSTHPETGQGFEFPRPAVRAADRRAERPAGRRRRAPCHRAPDPAGHAAGATRLGRVLRGQGRLAVRREPLHRPGVQDRPARGLLLRARLALHDRLLPHAHGAGRATSSNWRMATTARWSTPWCAWASRTRCASARARPWPSTRGPTSPGQPSAARSTRSPPAAARRRSGAARARARPSCTSSAWTPRASAGGGLGPGQGRHLRARHRPVPRRPEAPPPRRRHHPTQWRAADIVREMEREGIAPGQILIEHEGRLIDYKADPHPYR